MKELKHKIEGIAWGMVSNTLIESILLNTEFHLIYTHIIILVIPCSILQNVGYPNLIPRISYVYIPFFVNVEEIV